MDALEQTYLISQLKKYDASVKKQAMNNKKVYFADTAITSRIGFNATDNYGQQLENMVFIELMRRGEELYYHSDKQECDFVVRRDGQITAAYQVTVSMSKPETRKREIGGLLEAMNAYNLNEGYIVTLNDNATTELIEGKKVNVIPVGLWMLEGSKSSAFTHQ